MAPWNLPIHEGDTTMARIALELHAAVVRAGVFTAALTLALTIVACANDGAPSDAPIAAPGEEGTERAEQPTAAPKTVQAVKAAAREQADAYSSGDFGAAWDQWTKSAKKLLDRDGYIELAKMCDFGGVPLEVSSARLEGDDTAIVRIGLGNFLTAYTMRYEGGQWRWQPNDDGLALYRLAGAGNATESDCP